MNWISQTSRLALYLRDGLACAYCGQSVECGAKLTLDHLKAHSKGGDNSPTNLVTACERCNKSRGNRAVNSFCDAVAGYLNHGITGEAIRKNVRSCAARNLVAFRLQARQLIALRGSCFKAIFS